MGGGSDENKKCEHKYSGEIEGFLTCFQCGVVLEKMIFESMDRILPSSPKSKINFGVLHELLERGMINHEILRETKILVTAWCEEKKPYKKYHIIYGVFKTARANDYPLCLKELCAFFGEKNNVITKMEKVFGEVKNINPVNLINRVCGLLKIPFPIQKKIESKFSHLQKVISLNDIYICALCFKIYVPELKNRTICQALMISENFFSKNAHVLKEYLINRKTRAKISNN